MSLLAIFAIAVGLAMDAFSVSVAASIRIKQMTWRHTFRLAFHFGLFQFFMPLIGYAAGRSVEKLVRDFDHWVAFGLLAIVGGRMIVESFKHAQEEADRKDPSRGLTLIILSVATSLDAVAVGLSLGVLGERILVPSIIIGVVCMVLSYVGTVIGRKIGEMGGAWVERLGGAVLILIGAKIIFDHLSS